MRRVPRTPRVSHELVGGDCGPDDSDVALDAGRDQRGRKLDGVVGVEERGVLGPLAREEDGARGARRGAALRHDTEQIAHPFAAGVCEHRVLPRRKAPGGALRECRDFFVLVGAQGVCRRSGAPAALAAQPTPRNEKTRNDHRVGALLDVRPVAAYSIRQLPRCGFAGQKCDADVLAGLVRPVERTLRRDAHCGRSPQRLVAVQGRSATYLPRNWGSAGARRNMVPTTKRPIPRARPLSRIFVGFLAGALVAGQRRA